jgi:tripartite-type tricarboxylate transporter receptor subunit TctC
MSIVQSGKARPLAVTTLQRLDKLPDVPPLADTYPGIDIVSWSGLFGPAGMPKPIVDKLFTELQATLADPDVQAKLAASGFNVVPSKSPAEFGQYVEYQIGVWSKLVKQAGIEPQ